MAITYADEGEGPEGYHFVVRGWEDAQVLADMGECEMRRKPEAFRRQARTLLIEAATALAHLEWSPHSPPAYYADPDFSAPRGRLDYYGGGFSVCLGWRYKIFAYVENIIYPRDDDGAQGPPKDIVVYLKVSSVKALPRDVEDEEDSPPRGGRNRGQRGSRKRRRTAW